MIESETIETNVKSNDKDDFSMDPIFNEIIEPSLRITSGKILLTSNINMIRDFYNHWKEIRML